MDNTGDNLSTTSPGAAAGEPEQPAAPVEEGRGVDLARRALEEARAQAKERGVGIHARRVPVRRGGIKSGSARRRRWSGPGSDDRDPQLLGHLTNKLVQARGWSEEVSAGSVLGRWDNLVGPDIASHAKPVSLQNGELTVQAESTAWATQLRTMQRQLLATIAAAVGDGVVTRITFHGPSAPSWRRGERHVRGRGPRDTYG
ncbi:DciA family protein [Rhodococcus sp. X156]|uniref:DciA family protein n=1 Tax=Rhodococcus sp. X156 TaxID=2499145 RepID=UPI0024084021|nr:DciA family protein [Rhodococcus sp. X156]